jgi:hypothetical protein
MARREQRRQSRRPYFYGPVEGQIGKIGLAFGVAETGVENRRSREWAPRFILSQFKVKTDHRSSHD